MTNDLELETAEDKSLGHQFVACNVSIYRTKSEIIELCCCVSSGFIVKGIPMLPIKQEIGFKIVGHPGSIEP